MSILCSNCPQAAPEKSVLLLPRTSQPGPPASLTDSMGASASVPAFFARGLCAQRQRALQVLLSVFRHQAGLAEVIPLLSTFLEGRRNEGVAP